ncbi:class D sortase [Alkalicoccobacillus porphyridii]|uniref:Class D sortase n=1 Tax=Alkalicoccobacillus porphyridii TaxID=2597270 RepID=A0A553ZU39_9BACI|nr:class D sortase [Alkalicoccobacillus porphyridii]TSB44972.1 class D sortase [Alkalicoccobacillus porphyridii]
MSRRSEKRTKRLNKRFFLLFFTAALIVFGLWFTTTNAYKFAKGYFLFKTEQVEAQTPSAEKPKVETPEPTEPIDWWPEQGELMGELEIPAIKATLPIYHGTDDNELDQGVGHFAQSVLPGDPDNSVLSGHRDTVFRKLGDVGEGDTLIVRTKIGEYTYKIFRQRIVDEDDRTVIVSTEEAQLTLTTCYPFEFVGSAPDRYVLEAELIDTTLYSELADFDY